jgi:hypothetical protein
LYSGKEVFVQNNIPRFELPRSRHDQYRSPFPRAVGLVRVTAACCRRLADDRHEID